MTRLCLLTIKVDVEGYLTTTTLVLRIQTRSMDLEEFYVENIEDQDLVLDVKSNVGWILIKLEMENYKDYKVTTILSSKYCQSKSKTETLLLRKNMKSISEFDIQVISYIYKRINKLVIYILV